jgi:hypothetical protein
MATRLKTFDEPTATNGTTLASSAAVPAPTGARLTALPRPRAIPHDIVVAVRYIPPRRSVVRELFAFRFE